MNFDTFLLESKASEEAHKLGLVAAGYGLWRDKTGKVVKKTEGDNLVDVRGSEANINHYHTNVPANRRVNHAAHDESTGIISSHETPGTHKESEVSKYHIDEHSAVHKDKLADMHNALTGAGYKHTETGFGHIYEKGDTSVHVSTHPDRGHKKGQLEGDHHSIITRTKHAPLPKDKSAGKKDPKKG